MKIIIAGTRDFDDYDLLVKTWDDLSDMVKFDYVQIVSGKARGADTLGEELAHDLDIPVAEFPANWEEHGRAAGYIRNIEMAKYADVLIAFWDGKSRGTKHMISQAIKHQLFVKVVKYER